MAAILSRPQCVKCNCTPLFRRCSLDSFHWRCKWGILFKYLSHLCLNLLTHSRFFTARSWWKWGGLSAKSRYQRQEQVITSPSVRRYLLVPAPDAWVWLTNPRVYSRVSFVRWVYIQHICYVFAVAVAHSIKYCAILDYCVSSTDLKWQVGVFLPSFKHVNSMISGMNIIHYFGTGGVEHNR